MDDEIELSEDQTDEVLDWAVKTATALVIMYARKHTVDDDDDFDEHLSENLDVIVESMPEFFQEIVTSIANEIIEEVEEEDRMVHDFIAEIERFSRGEASD